MKFIATTALILAGTLAAVSAPAKPARQPSPGVMRGQSFAQQHCAGCHAITFDQGSPNPESPPFPDIANRPGLTGTTLRRFLRDSHNFPDAMNFSVDRAQIHDLADYMVTLKRKNYRPAI